jgi:caffeoyl-CoA O-methyltransferase
LTLSPQLRTYVQRWGVREHPSLVRCREETQAAGFRRSSQISPEQGAFMQAFARAMNARTALEIGVFTGYSCIAVALALRDMHGRRARLVALELSEEAIRKAERYWRDAELSDVIEPRIGPAAEQLQALIAAGETGSFDLIFLDADKPNYDHYYEACLQLLRPGGVMLVDNMFWGGDVADPDKHGPCTDAVRNLGLKIHGDDRVHMSLATIGDGLSIVIKR